MNREGQILSDLTPMNGTGSWTFTYDLGCNLITPALMLSYTRILVERAGISPALSMVPP